MNIVFNICLFRGGLACSMFKGEIWTAGGWNHEDLDVVEVLTLVTNTWRSGPKLTRRRVYLTISQSKQPFSFWRVGNRRQPRETCW